MKFLPFVPLLALMATAQAAPDTGRPVPLGSLLGDRVMTLDGRDVGELEDVLLRTTGELEEYLVDFEKPDDTYNRRALTLRDDVADYGEPPYYEGESVEGTLQADHVAARPEQVVLERSEEDVVRLNLGPEGVSGLAPRDDRRFAQREYVGASEVIGLEVHLADAESYGSVEEIMLTPEGDAIAAYVIDSWHGFDKRRVALPPDAVKLVTADGEAAIRNEYGVVAVRSSYTVEKVATLPEFDLDAYTDDALDF